MRMVQILPDTHQRLIQRQPGFHADDGEIQCVWQTEPNALLARGDHPFQKEAWEKEAETRNPSEQSYVIEALGKWNGQNKSDYTAQDARTEVVVQMRRIAVSRLNQPSPSPGYVRRGEWNGFGERIDNLLEPFSKRRFSLGSLRLPAESPQSSPQNRAGSNHRRAQEKDYQRDGDKDDDCENQCQHKFKPECE